MHLKFRGVNDAFRELVFGIKTGSIHTRRSPSRVGDVLMIEEPVTITYSHPRERVLFNRARDANPFMHLYESLWMLAGRQDIAPIEYYAANYAAQVRDGDSPNANGAYGYRWRNADKYCLRNPFDEETDYFPCRVDQFTIIIDHLKEKPESRRAVLQMWNVEDDLLKIDTSKDVACNTNVYFSLRKIETMSETDGSSQFHSVLDMTVCNRSNDLVWGSLGANVVHFSFLQEYLAACLGAEVGVYNQFSNNLHVYVDRFEPDKWLADETDVDDCILFPLVRDPSVFDREVSQFVESSYGENFRIGNWDEPFLQNVAAPMCWAFFNHKRRDYASALQAMDLVQAEDWRIAGVNWINRRKTNWEAKNANTRETAADSHS